jgi:hypothetical protein
MTPWTLGIDFGTTFTVGAIGQEGGRRTIDIESDGSSRMPSAVLLDEAGDLLVGQSALHQAPFHPDRFEATPKRTVGEGTLLLGDRLVTVTDAIAAVIGRVETEARRVAGGTAPSRTVLTHPADWGSARLDVLRDAADSAEFASIELVPEPVAAAFCMGGSTLRRGDHVAVYDFGGGTFDAAILRRTKEGFEVVGPPGGRDPLGGEDIDNTIIDFLGSGPLGENPDWRKIVDPPDLQWRRNAANLRAEVRKAKEGLSGQKIWQLWVQGLEQEVQLEAETLNRLIAEDIAATVTILLETVSAAGLVPSDLAGIFLVGGSSRIPLVATEVWKRTEVKPIVEGDPKTVVALGATGWRPPRPWQEPEAEGETGDRNPASTFTSSLAMATRTLVWYSGTHCYGYLTVTPCEVGGAVELSDEPAVGDLAAVAEAAGERLSSTPGYQELSCERTEWLGEKCSERRFVTEDQLGSPWLERYVVHGERAYVGSAPEHLASRLNSVTRSRPFLDAERFYQFPMSCELFEGDRAHERLELIRGGTFHRVTAESYEIDPELAEERLDAYRDHPNYTLLGQSTARLLGPWNSTWRLGIAEGLPGQLYTFVSANDPMRLEQTRIWIGQAGGRTYLLVATLPERDKLKFRPLLAHAVLASGDGSGPGPASAVLDAASSIFAGRRTRRPPNP